MSACPVCNGVGSPLLHLARQPIYQHPVPSGVTVPAPHAVDLTWLACTNCAHAWQPDFDAELLAGIYRSYYYTPAPAGIGVQFQDDFLAAAGRFGVLREGATVLEIGASSGELLAEVAGRVHASRAYAFEPNSDNARVARARGGLEVHEEFFGAAIASRKLAPADLIYSRHVIEHIFDFKDFFAGLRSATADGADLLLETPSLDFHAERGSLDPFHVEHIHVFALRSLVQLAGANGWGLRDREVTASGNLIAWFRKGAPSVDVLRPQLTALQRAVDARRDRLSKALGDRALVFWGAGSSGINLATTLGREPDFWTDGNPAKEGKHFVGLSGVVVSPATAFELVQQGKFAAPPALVITSTFVREILPRVRELGWRGDVFDCDGNPL
jgi:hypothetical protein